MTTTTEPTTAPAEPEQQAPPGSPTEPLPPVPEAEKWELAPTMTEERAAMLRAPFPPSAVGKLPRVTCRKCSDADSRVCNEHSKVECDECGNYMTVRHIPLDYVGHAAVTDRLLAVDPMW
jgi:hypothetical protein